MNIKDILQMDNCELENLIRYHFFANLNRILDERKLSFDELMDGIQISTTSRWAYKTNNTFPNTSTLLKISIFLNVTINDLLLPKEIKDYLTENVSSQTDFYSNIEKILLIVENIVKEIVKK